MAKSNISKVNFFWLVFSAAFLALGRKVYVVLTSAFRSKDLSGKAVRDINRRRWHTSSTDSEFGRLPQDTAKLLAHLVQRTTGPISAALPLDAGPAMAKDTVRIVLDYLLLDWRENRNLSGIDDTDVQDICSFITFACSFVDAPYSGASQATYKTVLTYLMRDWLNNWNADGVSGPPQR